MRPGEAAKVRLGLADFAVHDCGVSVRPCPYSECRHHLGLSAKEIRHGLKGTPYSTWSKRGKKVTDTSDTCALDVADKNPDGQSLEQIGRRLGVTRERVRQIEHGALRKVLPILQAITGGRHG